MSREQDQLGPEERELADALARATPRRGPPPQVDAAILASARAALRKDAAPSARARRRRWPAALGVAASLALAVGIAWQLRPVPDEALPPVTEGPPPRPAASKAAERPAQAARGDVAAERDAVPATAAPPQPMSAPEPEAAESSPPPEPQEQAPPREQAPLSPPVRDAAPPPPPPAPPAPPAPAAEPPVVADQPAPAAAASAAADTPPTAETAIGRTRVRQEAASRPAAARAAGKPTAVAAPAPPAAESRDDAESDGAGIVFDRKALHDVPPATVDSPAIHRAWLDRIRELRDAGELDAARESLREYRRRYPDQALPDDLDGLLDE